MSIPTKLRIAFIIPDNRDEFHQYDQPLPVFGPAPDALLSGFAHLAEEGLCEVHAVSCTRQPSAAPAKIYGGHVFYHQLRVNPIGYLKTFYWGCTRAIGHCLGGIQPDIVHGQGTERYCALAAVRSGFPNVLTVHGNMRSVARMMHARPLSFYWLAARLESWVLPRTDGVVCLSNYTRKEVQSLARRTWVLPNAEEEKLFTTHHAPFSGEHFRLSCLGTICQHKNQNWLIRALAPLQSELGFTLHLYGAGDPGSSYGSEFESLVAQYDWVRTYGHVSRAELPKVYGTSDLVLVPSLQDNCPMVILEAMACGAPVIGASIGGIPDLIQPEKTGWIFESQNVQAFQELVRRVLRHPERLASFGQEAKSVALQRFFPRTIALQHLDIYRQVLH